jgi:hypothetical protein
MAHPGFEYLVYLPAGSHPIESLAGGVSGRLGTRLASLGLFARTVSVHLPSDGTWFDVEWFNPATDKIIPVGSTPARGLQRFTAPFHGDAVLHIRRSPA